MIATDDTKAKEKEEVDGESNANKKKSRKHMKQKLDSEFGVVRGIDFKNVFTVCQCYPILCFLGMKGGASKVVLCNFSHACLIGMIFFVFVLCISSGYLRH